MKSALPKQFLTLAGRPLLMHSLAAFAEACPGISLVVALPFDQFDTWQQLCREHAFSLLHRVTAGGETRFRSVQQALQFVDDDSLVAVHDGARPLVPVPLIMRMFEEAELYGNCIPVIPVNESVRIMDGTQSRPADRSLMRIVQTPQVFHAGALRRAYTQEYDVHFTDDATVMENMGETIRLSAGDPANIKITYPHDLAVAEILFKNLHG